MVFSRIDFLKKLAEKGKGVLNTKLLTLQSHKMWFSSLKEW
jgi:hypothetical protein